MSKFSELDLKWWEKEDLEDLFEEHPELENMTIEEMNEFAKNLYREASYLIDRANFLEGQADTLRTYIDAIAK